MTIWARYILSAMLLATPLLADSTSVYRAKADSTRIDTLTTVLDSLCKEQIETRGRLLAIRELLVGRLAAAEVAPSDSMTVADTLKGQRDRLNGQRDSRRP